MQHPPKLIPLLNDIFSSAWVAEDVSCFQLNSEKCYKHFEVNVTGHLCTDQSKNCKTYMQTSKPQTNYL